jgi:RHS repeat-associated protein
MLLCEHHRDFTQRVSTAIGLLFLFAWFILPGCGNSDNSPGEAIKHRVALGPICGGAVTVMRLDGTEIGNCCTGQYDLLSDTIQCGDKLLLSRSEKCSAGTFSLNIDQSSLSDDDLVILVVTGGQDIDPNDDGLVNANEGTEGPMLYGEMYAIVRLCDLVNEEIIINPFTTMSFAGIQSSSDSDEIKARLDNLARYLFKDPSSSSGYGDLNGDDVVDMFDLYRYDPSNHNCIQAECSRDDDAHLRGQHLFEQLLPDDDDTKTTFIENLLSGMGSAYVQSFMASDSGYGDADGDGLANVFEDPDTHDTDGDGLLDGNFEEEDMDNDSISDEEELRYGLNPWIDDFSDDLDHDDLSNGDEIINGLDPTNSSDGASADSDGDGTDNGTEISAGTNPKNAAPKLNDGNFVLTIDENTTGTLKIDATDAEGDDIWYVLSGSSQHGSSSINDIGEFTYIPQQDFSGKDTAAILIGDDDNGESDTAIVDIIVNAIVETETPSAQISANPETIIIGESSTLSWESENASSCNIDPDIGIVHVSGTVDVSPTETTTYTITATGPGGTTTADAAVTVTYPEPTVSLTATPESISIRESSTLSWSSTDADTCEITPDVGTVDPSGSVDVSPTETTTYTITAIGAGGTTTAVATVTMIYPSTVGLTATPESIFIGESSLLSWFSTGADTCEITPDVGTVDPSGLIDVSPTETTTYTIIATGPGGTATADVTVMVIYSEPTVSLTATPGSILSGESSALSWSSTDADTCEITPDVGTVATSGLIDVSPTETTTYTITATGPGGTATDDVTVTVTYSEPAVILTAMPESILSGESSTLSWSSTNADTCEIAPDVGTVDTSGSIDVSPTETTTYTITATGPGGTVTDDVTVTYPEPTVSLTATPESILSGESSTLSWSSTNADTCEITPDVGTVDTSGSIDVSPAEATTYTITATGPGGTATGDVTVTVTYPLPTVSLSADPEIILPGGSSTLSWDSSNAESCVIEPDIGSVDLSGSVVISPEETTTYTLTATGPGGVGTAETTITIDTSSLSKIDITQPVDMAEIDADAAQVTGSVNLVGGTVWVNGIEATISGSMFTADNVPLAPGANRIVVSAFIPDTTDPLYYDEIMVVRQYTYASQAEGSFGEQYEDLVPSDAMVSAYDVTRFALVTGAVYAVDESPLPGVTVSILNHPEYGTSLSEEDGRFSIPLEGGRTVTLNLQKDGLLSSQRKLYVPWNEIAVVEGVQMAAADTAASTVILNGNADTVATHRGEEVIDAFGSRAATVTISGDNKAFIVDDNGNKVEELSEITVRATTYTASDAMPAELPPTSAYTYCVELSVDEAENVSFEKPVITWVENFLGFDVGTAVPSGYYDRPQGAWVPSENGVVVKLIDTDGDGAVDALDADGDDQPDDLDQDGLFYDEVSGLDDSVQYQPGDIYWRVPVFHFSSWDFNWPVVYSDDVIEPNPSGSSSTDAQPVEDKSCTRSQNSFVEDRSRVFHEDIPIPGTDITLHYASNRVDGYHAKITVPASGETVPDSLQRIIVKVEIAGQTFEQTLDPLPNQETEIIWDGLDYLGRPVKGSSAAYVSLGFVYDGYYAMPSSTDRSFGLSGTDSTGISAQVESTLWSATTKLPITKGRGNIAEGWTLSPHHELHLADPTPLHKGDGTINKNINILANTIAGNGVADYSGDNGPAIEAGLDEPWDVEVDSYGNLYVVGPHSVRKIDTDGVITTIAGFSEWSAWLTNNRPAIESGLEDPMSVAVDNAGNVFIADSGHHCIRKVDTNGIITTVAGIGYGYGGGDYGYDGNGGPATEALLYSPHGIALDNAGNMYIADYNNQRVRKVDPGGIITSVAGNGEYGDGGDGGLATEAQFKFPHGLAVDAAGNLYISDSQSYRIRKVDPSGIITTVAGTGESGYSGDGGPATEAKISIGSGSIEIDADSNLYFADRSNSCIRKVFSDGTITTVAGTGQNGYSGDGGPATESQMNYPRGLAVDPAGNLYIADTFNNCVRKVAPVMAFQNLIDAGEIPFAEDYGIGHITYGTGRHKSTIDLATGSVLREFEYDDEDRLTGILDQFGNLIAIERDGDGFPEAIISPDGIMTELTIDENNNLTGIIYPDGSSYNFEYTTEGLMNAEIEPEGNRFEHEFDDIGRLDGLYDDEGGNWQYSRTTDGNGDILIEVLSAEGNLTTYLDHTDFDGVYTSTITDPTGSETLFTQSADGLTVNKSLPCGMDLIFEYDLDPEYKFEFVKKMTESIPSGLSRITERTKNYEDTNADGVPDLVTDILTVNSKTTIRENDALLGTKTTTSPEGRTVTSLYDPTTLLTLSVSVPELFDTVYGYDDRGRPTSVYTNTRQTTFSYDSAGFLESVTDPENHTTTYDYDAVGRVTAIYRPDGGTVGFTYDGNGNMTVLSNPFDIHHGFGYNAVNLSSSYQTPLSGTYSYVYDKDRRLTQTNFPSGKQIVNIYDTARLSQIQTPEGNIFFTYLCGDKVESITQGAESITYGYDGKLVTSETLSGTLSGLLEYTHDDDFSVVSFSYAGNTESYTYDDDGLLTGAGSFTIARNVDNGLPESVSGGSLSISRTPNGYGEVSDQDVTVSGQEIGSWSLTRDDNGRIVEKTEAVGGTTSTDVYTYDAKGRLLTVTTDGSLVEEYDYDAAGARTYEMNALRGIAERSYTYSDEDHLLTAGSAAYSYDLDGYLTSRTDGSDVTDYSYSSRGELLSVNLPDGTAIEYGHDPLGRRITKKVDGVITEKYLWQGLTRLLAVYDGSDNLLMRFEYADGRMPVAMAQSGVRYYLSYDQVGSLQIVADTAGNVVKRIAYDTFGNIIDDSNPSFEVPFGFAGGLHDRDTGLVRFGHRDYDPDIGRWTAKDPILFAGGDTDLYGYCLNDPVSANDPCGLEMYRHGYDTKPLGQQISEFTSTIVNSLNIFTKGQKNALLKTGLGTGLIIGGAITLPEGTPFIAVGIPMLAEGLALDVVEFGFHGDTSDIPSNWEIFGTVVEQIYELIDPCQ